MPLPLAAAPPLIAAPLVGPVVGPVAVGAAKALALECLPAASSLSAAAILARIAINRIPDWIKNDITFSGVRKRSGIDAASKLKADELECLSSVLEKLNALAETTYQHHEQCAPNPHLYASLLAYMQLVAQHKRLRPGDRNKRYHDAGTPYDVMPLSCSRGRSGSRVEAVSKPSVQKESQSFVQAQEESSVLAQEESFVRAQQESFVLVQQEVSSNEQEVSSNEQEVSSNEQEVSSNEQEDFYVKVQEECYVKGETDCSAEATPFFHKELSLGAEAFVEGGDEVSFENEANEEEADMVKESSSDSESCIDTVSCVHTESSTEADSCSKAETFSEAIGYVGSESSIFLGAFTDTESSTETEACTETKSCLEAQSRVNKELCVEPESLVKEGPCPGTNSYLETKAHTETESFVHRDSSILRPTSTDDTMNEIIDNAPATEVETLLQALHLATLAYYIEDEECVKDNLSNMGYSALNLTSAAEMPGHLSYFVAVSEKTQTLLISVKGTSCLEDIATDFCAQSVSYHPHLEEECEGPISTRVEVTINLSQKDSVDNDTGVIDNAKGQERICVEGGSLPVEENIICHEGFLISAKRLVQNVSSHVKELVIEKHYKLHLVGHSLGAAAVCLAVTILQARLPDLDHRQLHVYAFGPPPVFDHDTALSSTHYITSIVNSSDVVTRLSLANATVLVETLCSVSEHLIAQNLAPNSPCSASAFLRKIVFKGKDDDHLLMNLDQIEHAVERSLEKIPLKHTNHLYIPGRVLLLHKDWSPNEHNDGGNKKEGKGDNPGERTTSSDNPQFCTVTNGAAPVLRLVEMDGYQMLGDHTTASYEAALRALLPSNATPRDIPIVLPSIGSGWSKIGR